MIGLTFRGIHPVDWRSPVRMGDDHAYQTGSSPGGSLQKRAPLAPPPVRENGGLVLIRGVLLILGILLIIGGYLPWQRSLASSHWPVVEGEIVHSALMVPGATSEGWVHRFFYRTRIEYRYSLDRKIHTGSRIEFGLGDQMFLVREFAQRMVQRYPLGKPVLVTLDPKDPTHGVLETIPSAGGSLIFMVLGIICMAVRYFLGLREEWRLKTVL
ncbi:MAG: DUF3592 domain-containing protein [Magnetococcales bacterium]|nr:DUF3592 domain-containing protein [Magnetococcales bacterium]